MRFYSQLFAACWIAGAMATTLPARDDVCEERRERERVSPLLPQSFES
jgi:hypothetical protein